MADGNFATLVSKDTSLNAVANPIWVELSDGAAALTNLDVTVTNAAGASAVNIQDGGNSITVDGTVELGATTLAALESITVQNGAGAGAVNIQDGGNSITVDGSVSISGTVTVTATDLDIRDLNLTQDAVRISANTSANTAGNPIFVQFSSGVITGEVHDYNTATVAGGATSNHDYTVATAMLVKSIEFSSSGAGKVQLLTGPVASLVAKWTGFIPKQGGTVSVKFDPAIEVPVTSTGTVRLIRTNREGSSQDLYSTIVGIDA